MSWLNFITKSQYNQILCVWFKEKNKNEDNIYSVTLEIIQDFMVDRIIDDFSKIVWTSEGLQQNEQSREISFK